MQIQQPSQDFSFHIELDESDESGSSCSSDFEGIQQESVNEKLIRANGLKNVPSLSYSSFPHNSIGLIIAYRKDGSFEFGTGALVSPNLVITAGHVASNASDQIVFHLAVKGQVHKQEGIKCIGSRSPWQQKSYFRSSSHQKHLDYRVLRLAERIILNPSQYFKPEIIQYACCFYENTKKLKICGYPGYKSNFKGIKKTKNFRACQFYQEDFITGQIHKLDQIRYSINTEHGESGGPLLYGKAYVGIHTRFSQSKSANAGLLFNIERISNIIQMGISLGGILFEWSFQNCKCKPSKQLLASERSNFYQIQNQRLTFHCDQFDSNFLLNEEKLLMKIGTKQFHGIVRLKLDRNQLLCLDLSHNLLIEYLDVSNNRIDSINLDKNKKLKSILLNSNNLYEINLDLNLNLQWLNISNNYLKSIDLQRHRYIKVLQIRQNLLQSIQVSFQKLQQLYLSGNELSQINLKKCHHLSLLFLDKNKIQKINLSQNSELTCIDLSQNLIQQLDLSANHKLNKLYLLKNPQIRDIQYSIHCSLTCLQISLKKNTQKVQKPQVSSGDNKFIANHQLMNLLLNSIGITHITAPPIRNIIKVLNLHNNAIKQIDVSPFTNIQKLCLSNNMLSSIDVKSLLRLINFDISKNYIVELDLLKNKRLKCIDASKNQLVSIELYSPKNKNKSIYQTIILSQNKLQFIRIRPHPQIKLQLLKQRSKNCMIECYFRRNEKLFIHNWVKTINPEQHQLCFYTIQLLELSY